METSGESSGTTATLEGARRTQARRVLMHLATAGPAARTDVAAATGLSRHAIATITAKLAEAGLLRAGDARTGTRSTQYEYVDAEGDLVTLVLGVDAATATVSAFDGTELVRYLEPLGQTPDALDALAAVLRRSLAHVERAEGRVVDVSVVVPSAVAGDPQVVVNDTAFGWGTCDVIGGLAERAPGLAELAGTLPSGIRLVSLGAAAARAELDGLPVDDLLYLSSDAAITGAIVSGGRLVRGGHGLAGDLAHLPVDYDGVRCECGQRGCLVTVAGPDIVLERAGLAPFAEEAGRLAALDEFVDLVRAGDDRANWSWLDASLWIGRALQMLALAVDPSVIVLGGTWAELPDEIRAAFRANRPVLGDTTLADIPPIVVASAGPDSALQGARQAARERIIDERLSEAFPAH
ncbi:ROK family transcriptional regulator [Agromyces archimandritae]|uniref:ROK family transcriptional regulator n=1 Tax=Agromyces archimandritae TaxID=2781962 RepID=A0A975FKL4_9MICO|nr:ROK family transcriptional regulator [Agromyces archimandritae]QTX03482.1 ROK family transcriptional regulator [Agromyces archimandritae]